MVPSVALLLWGQLRTKQRTGRMFSGVEEWKKRWEGDTEPLSFEDVSTSLGRLLPDWDSRWSPGQMDGGGGLEPLGPESSCSCTTCDCLSLRIFLGPSNIGSPGILQSLPRLL